MKRWSVALVCVVAAATAGGYFLSPLLQGHIVSAMRAIREQEITVLVTEQYARPIFPVINRGYIIENGTLILTGSGQALMDNPEVRAAYFGV